MIAAAWVQSLWSCALGGGGKSGLRRAVCRITSGICASRHKDGQCNREDTAPERMVSASEAMQAAGGKGEKVR